MSLWRLDAHQYDVMRCLNISLACPIGLILCTVSRTYPFWRSNTFSMIDWRAEAATCEGIQLPSSSDEHTVQEASSEQRHTEEDVGFMQHSKFCQDETLSLDRFHAFRHAGHPHASSLHSQEQVCCMYLSLHAPSTEIV